MITELQEKEIRDYLLEKNLSIHLLIEVQDHMISQIYELQKQENLNFQDAFERVQLKWFADLRFPKYNIQFDLQDTTYFEKLILKHQQINILKQGLVVTALLLVLLFILSRLSMQPQFTWFLVTFVAISMLLPVIQYYDNLKAFKLTKKYDNYKLTSLQNLNHLSLSFAGGFMSFYFNFESLSSSIFESLNFNADGFMNFTLPLLIFYFLLNTCCLIGQRNFLKQLKSVKPFLKYLKASL